MKTEDFKNTPFLDFNDPANQAAQTEAIEMVRASLGREFPLLIGGEEIVTEGKLVTTNPANTSEVVATFSSATEELAEKAVLKAAETFETWKKVPYQERAAIGFKAAEIMRRRRLEVNAWMITEAGKSWAEADADTAEAIDFLDFYAREAMRYGDTQPITPLPDENNAMFYIPLGVGAVIPPWNFPMAILAGMTSAAWITGNTVVLKPASTTPMMGQIYMEIIKEAGLPDGVVNYLPGPGRLAGNTLVEHPQTRFICFTGSMEVGLGINAKAAMAREGQIWIKRVVVEMGGKDSIIVDEEVPNLDEAVAGTLASAFGFQGQKCSACSRVIVHESIYDSFVEKLQAKVAEIKQGDPTDLGNYMGPVINQGAYDKIMSYMAVGAEEGRLISGGKGDDSKGYFIEPTVFADIDPMARLSQEEIFGPVLAVIKSRDYDHALEIANNTVYGLTGAVYSKNPEKLERARREFHVGNLYLNRKCTGALVGSQPFGGFNMSGTDSKAGGRDYLLLFLQAKTVSEKPL